jgi:hypothetical protein
MRKKKENAEYSHDYLCKSISVASLKRQVNV